MFASIVTEASPLSERHYLALGQSRRIPVAECVAGYERLAARFDPRHRPTDQQPLWLDFQNAIDEALAVIVDSERMGAGR